MLTDRVQRWLTAGEMEEVAGHQLYVHHRPGSTAPLLVFLHGFPSSSYDWRELLELPSEHAALAFDCLGFGLSDKPRDHLYTIGWQADAAEELVRRAGSPPVFLVAHDMGTSIATELMTRDLRGELSINVTGVLLFNGGMLLHLITPTIGQRLLRSPLGPAAARLTSERAFRSQFARLFSATHPLSSEEAADQWTLLAHNGGHRLGHRLVHYMDERERLTERWHGAVRDWAGPVSLAWGLHDPVATPKVLDGLRALRPGIDVVELPDLGHYPQIENPSAIAGALDAALERTRLDA